MTFRVLTPEQAPAPNRSVRRTSRVRRYGASIHWSTDRRIDGRCPRCNKPWDDHPTSECALTLQKERDAS